MSVALKVQRLVLRAPLVPGYYRRLWRRSPDDMWKLACAAAALRGVNVLLREVARLDRDRRARSMPDATRYRRAYEEDRRRRGAAPPGL